MRGRAPTRRLQPLARLAALILLVTSAPAWADETKSPLARAFVYPLGSEDDFTKPAAGSAVGFRVSDPYLAVRAAKGNSRERVHYGVDLSNGRSGDVVRAIATGVVEVSDGNALLKVRKAERVKVSKVVKGKRVKRTVTRYRTTTRWRSGWGNRVVIRHLLPNGRLVYSLYAHLLPKSVLVHTGELVAAGQPIARVGRTGRATAPHLHLEIRTAKVDERHVAGLDSDEESGPEGEESEILPNTVDPLAFLESHVVHYRDLSPGTWESRYAVAACKDGVMTAPKGYFEPRSSITRSEFYGALVSAFRLGTPFTKENFDSRVDALVDTGVLDSAAREQHAANERMTRSDALELILRCLDRRPALGPCLSSIDAFDLARDFNREFAGRLAATEAERQSRALADSETTKLRKDALAKEQRAAKAAKERGRRRRAKPVKITPVEPVPILDPGFESLAHSAKSLSRAEACLLLASALRIGSSKLSALERAAARVASSSSSG